ncbi:MAG: dimethylaniline monooxygenase (N-oxide forming) / hypotaurine monooxygenase, partial [Mucilaginibacter sp.]|nr:dimethylaniline monooxygenase (N-oxide forming) / hypotaurine monooxygenase [Mucilaginibacter sp.]
MEGEKTTRVAIIGAGRCSWTSRATLRNQTLASTDISHVFSTKGISGLVALKECLASGLEAHVFEARPDIGGNWNYEPVPANATTDGTGSPNVTSSMYDGVMCNSCRDTTGFTDFPLDPLRYGDYFNHRHMLRYLRDYTDHFGLLQHIRLRTRVLSCSPLAGGADGWKVATQEEGQPVEEGIYQ